MFEAHIWAFLWKMWKRGLGWSGEELEKRSVKSLGTFPLFPVFCFYCMPGIFFLGTSGVFFFFSLSPLLFSVLSWRRVTVKSTKEQNPWIYCQRMRDTSEREGWRKKGKEMTREDDRQRERERVETWRRRGWDLERLRETEIWWERAKRDCDGKWDGHKKWRKNKRNRDRRRRRDGEREEKTAKTSFLNSSPVQQEDALQFLDR